MNYSIENIRLAYTPLTKQLLTIYVKAIYEEEARISEDILQQEYNWLVKNNQLEQLFLAEYIISLSQE